MKSADIISASTISAVWRELGGDLPKRGRARAFYRNGDNPQAVSLDNAKGVWTDHRDNVGGGVLDLIVQVRGGTRAEALRWLSGYTGLPLDNRPLSPAERRDFVDRRRIRSEASFFTAAARMMAETALESMEAEDPEREVHTALLAALRITPVEEYRAWRKHHPRATAALVVAGRRRERRLQRMLAKFTAEIANAA